MEERVLLELSTNGNTANIYIFADEIVGYTHHNGGGCNLLCSYGREYVIDLTPSKLWKLLVEQMGATFKKTGDL